MRLPSFGEIVRFFILLGLVIFVFRSPEQAADGVVGAYNIVASGGNSVADFFDRLTEGMGPQT